MAEAAQPGHGDAGARPHPEAAQRLPDGDPGAQQRGRGGGVEPVGEPVGEPVADAVVIAMSMAWSPVSNVYAATAEEPPEVHERRRALLRESVRRAVTTG
ncbi:hypothetical protein GCM10023320_09680 [Pseudonocardia adelaidensis]|uniref:TetR family transcriptional regulator n=1 Tax=Pseudonocardia adelaidensis TaxID=648754 RepID=A0ABP9ND54_9PSEU